jgi:uncharacterized RmlC-like cupin family protein
MSSQAVLMRAGTGDSVSLRGTEVTFKLRSESATGASCVEFSAVPGFDAGVHVHTKLEEAFYVLDGEFELRAGDEVLRAGPRSFMFAPPGVPHAFSNPTQHQHGYSC